MKCPNCHVDLKHLDMNGVVVDHCERCDGLWFDRGELDQAKGEADRALEGFDYPLWADMEKMSARNGERICPSCGKPMAVIDYAGYDDVPVDVCRHCRGIWLDKGEFEKIVAHLEELKDERSIASYLKDWEEEAKGLFAPKKGFFAEAKDLLIVSKLLLYRIGESIPPVAG